MDMSNVTTGGPSRGLLDVIFGKSKEEETPDGQELNPLMSLIKALTNKEQESNSQSAVTGRTDKGTISGKDSAESRVVGIPGMLMQMGMIQDATPQVKDSLRDEQAEKMAALIQMQQMQSLQNFSMQPLRLPEQESAKISLIPQLNAEQVNDILKSNNFPPLSESESKLLAEVNMQAAKANQAALLGNQADPKAADRLGGAELGKFLQELQKRGIDPEKIREAAASATAAPEKIVSTEAYLRMHDTLRPLAKNSDSPMGSDSTKAAIKDTSSLISGKQPIVSEGSGRSGKNFSDMFGNSGHDLLGKLGDESKLGNGSMDGAGAAFLQSLKTQLEPIKGNSQDIYLPAGKPELMKSALLNEVANTVNMQAIKGGGEMRLVVHPPEMGELKLKVGTKEGGNIEVHVTAQNDNVAGMIRDGSSELQKSLRDQNLNLAKFEVAVADTTNVASTDTKGSSMEQSFQQNQQQNSFTQNFGNGAQDRASRWDGNEQNQRPGGSFQGLMADAETKRFSAKPAISPRTYAGRSSSGRLDVVA